MVAVTIRNLPDEVRDELAARAARSGRSLQEYLAAALTDLAANPCVEDVLARARDRVRTTGSRVAVEDIPLGARRRPSVTLHVLDASALLAGRTDGTCAGPAVTDTIAGSALAAPELLPFETANVLRRLELGGQLASKTAALTHSDLLDLPVQLWPTPHSARVRGDCAAA